MGPPDKREERVLGKDRPGTALRTPLFPHSLREHPLIVIIAELSVTFPPPSIFFLFTCHKCPTQNDM
jgi:hypothetical protein